MSKHDRGAFGELLTEAKRRGCGELSFSVDLNIEGNDTERWEVIAYGDHEPGGCSRMQCCCIIWAEAKGRTGEEALRRLVESLKPADCLHSQVKLDSGADG